MAAVHPTEEECNQIEAVEICHHLREVECKADHHQIEVVCKADNQTEEEWEVLKEICHQVTCHPAAVKVVNKSQAQVTCSETTTH